MCSSIISFYPAENVHLSSFGCSTYKDLEFCEFDFNNLYGCNLTQLFSVTQPDAFGLFAKINANCDVYHCNEECKTAVAEVRRHPCFHGSVGDYTLDIMSRPNSLEVYKFISALRSCSCTTDDKDIIEFPHRPSGAFGLKAIGTVTAVMFSLNFL